MQLLAFQTGHRPLTHAGCYALERAFPAYLQPNLIHRYLDNSRVWHEFLLLVAGDCNLNAMNVDFDAVSGGYKAHGYIPDPPDRNSRQYIEDSDKENEEGLEDDMRQLQPPSRSAKQPVVRGEC